MAGMQADYVKWRGISKNCRNQMCYELPCAIKMHQNSQRVTVCPEENTVFHSKMAVVQ